MPSSNQLSVLNTIFRSIIPSPTLQIRGEEDAVRELQDLLVYQKYTTQDVSADVYTALANSLNSLVRQDDEPETEGEELSRAYWSGRLRTFARLFPVSKAAPIVDDATFKQMHKVGSFANYNSNQDTYISRDQHANIDRASSFHIYRNSFADLSRVPDLLPVVVKVLVGKLWHGNTTTRVGVLRGGVYQSPDLCDAELYQVDDDASETLWLAEYNGAWWALLPPSSGTAPRQIPGQAPLQTSGNLPPPKSRDDSDSDSSLSSITSSEDDDEADDNDKEKSKPRKLNRHIDGAPSYETGLPWDLMTDITLDEMIVYYPEHVFNWPGLAMLYNHYRHHISTPRFELMDVASQIITSRRVLTTGTAAPIRNPTGAPKGTKSTRGKARGAAPAQPPRPKKEPNSAFEAVRNLRDRMREMVRFAGNELCDNFYRIDEQGHHVSLYAAIKRDRSPQGSLEMVQDFLDRVLKVPPRNLVGRLGPALPLETVGKYITVHPRGHFAQRVQAAVRGEAYHLSQTPQGLCHILVRQLWDNTRTMDNRVAQTSILPAFNCARNFPDAQNCTVPLSGQLEGYQTYFDPTTNKTSIERLDESSLTRSDVIRCHWPELRKEVLLWVLLEYGSRTIASMMPREALAKKHGALAEDEARQKINDVIRKQQEIALKNRIKNDESGKNKADQRGWNTTDVFTDEHGVKKNMKVYAYYLQEFKKEQKAFRDRRARAILATQVHNSVIPNMGLGLGGGQLLQQPSLTLNVPQAYQPPAFQPIAHLPIAHPPTQPNPQMQPNPPTQINHPAGYDQLHWFNCAPGYQQQRQVNPVLTYQHQNVFNPALLPGYPQQNSPQQNPIYAPSLPNPSANNPPIGVPSQQRDWTQQNWTSGYQVNSTRSSCPNNTNAHHNTIDDSTIDPALLSLQPDRPTIEQRRRDLHELFPGYDGPPTEPALADSDEELCVHDKRGRDENVEDDDDVEQPELKRVAR